MWEPVDRSTMEHAFKHLNDGTCLHRKGERCVHGLGHQHDKAVGTTTTAVVTTVSPITSITPGPHGGHGTVIPPAATTSAPMSATIDAPPAPAPAHGTHFAGVDEATLSEARRKQSKPED